MTLLWSSAAEADRIAIFQLTAAESIFAADALDMLFEEGAEGLLETTSAGVPGSVPGTYELTVHPSYKLVFERRAGDVCVLALVHTKRNWPEA